MATDPEAHAGALVNPSMRDAFAVAASGANVPRTDELVKQRIACKTPNLHDRGKVERGIAPGAWKRGNRHCMTGIGCKVAAGIVCHTAYACPTSCQDPRSRCPRRTQGTQFLRVVDIGQHCTKYGVPAQMPMWRRESAERC